jgi:uncharacterized protein YjbI with pentapeptide repeats
MLNRFQRYSKKCIHELIKSSCIICKKTKKTTEFDDDDDDDDDDDNDDNYLLGWFSDDIAPPLQPIKICKGSLLSTQNGVFCLRVKTTGFPIKIIEQPQIQVKLTILPDGFFKIHEGSTVKLENGRFIRLNIPALCIKVVLETISQSEFIQDIHQSYLHQADLHQAELQQPDLHQAELQQPDLHQAELQQPELQQPDLHQAELQQPDLQQAELQQPELQQSDLQQSDYDSILSQNLNFDYEQQISSWDNHFDNSETDSNSEFQ